jgi:hypothetical protein
MRLIDLLTESELKAAALRKDLTNTLPPTNVMPSLMNSNGYPQYRHQLAMGVALAVERGEVEFSPESAMNQMQTVICYSPQEQEILDLTNKMMGVSGSTKLSKTPSKEPNWIQKDSPVRQFKDYD